MDAFVVVHHRWRAEASRADAEARLAAAIGAGLLGLLATQTSCYSLTEEPGSAFCYKTSGRRRSSGTCCS